MSKVNNVQAKLDTAKEYFNQGFVVTSTSSSVFAVIHRESRDKKNLVNWNRELSEEGKAKRKLSIAVDHERKVMLAAVEIQSKKLDFARKIRVIAEEILTAHVPEPDANIRKLFDQKVEGLIAKITFSPNAKEAVKYLQQLVDAADEPGLAEGIKANFMQLSNTLLATVPAADKAATRVNFGKMYDQLAVTARPYAEAANGLLDNATFLEQAPIAKPVVVGALREISDNASQYVNRPNEYSRNFKNKKQRQAGLLLGPFLVAVLARRAHPCNRI